MAFTYKSRGTIGIGNVLENILKNRGIENVKAFLNPSKEHLEDINCLDNIDLAVDMILNHNEKHSKVIVIQDCDTDGITSAAEMIFYIKVNLTNLTVDYTIHNGKEHGLDKVTMNTIINAHPNLVIIPDAGSNDLRELRELKRLGIDIIVLDHHDESEKTKRYRSIYNSNLTEYAVVVNNQMSPKATDKAMTGVGIVYKFCQAIDKKLGKSSADDYLDLVAVGMIADSCDLTNLQSRYLVLKGIEQINSKANKNKMITELIDSQSYSLHDKTTIVGISFYIAPLINSLIRLGSMEDKVILLKAFLNSDERPTIKIRGKGEVEVSIQEQARRLCETHKRKQKKLTDEYVDILKEQIDTFNLNSLPVICCKVDENIESTFTGLIANKLTSVYKKPCVLLRPTTPNYIGSARGFDKSFIKDIKQFCIDTHLFEFAEGHSNACGVSISNDNINAFYEYLSKIEFDNTLSYDVDTVFNDKTLTKSVIEAVSKYSDIWGTSVEEPIFAIENIIVSNSETEIKLIGEKKNTIKFLFHNIEFVKFNTNEKTYNDICSKGENVKFTIIGKFTVNEFNGTKTPQVVIENMMYEKSDVKKKFVF